MPSPAVSVRRTGPATKAGSDATLQRRVDSIVEELRAELQLFLGEFRAQVSGLMVEAVASRSFSTTLEEAIAAALASSASPSTTNKLVAPGTPPYQPYQTPAPSPVLLLEPSLQSTECRDDRQDGFHTSPQRLETLPEEECSSMSPASPVLEATSPATPRPGTVGFSKTAMSPRTLDAMGSAYRSAKDVWRRRETSSKHDGLASPLKSPAQSLSSPLCVSSCDKQPETPRALEQNGAPTAGSPTRGLPKLVWNQGPDQDSVDSRSDAVLDTSHSAPASPGAESVVLAAEGDSESVYDLQPSPPPGIPSLPQGATGWNLLATWTKQSPELTDGSKRAGYFLYPSGDMYRGEWQAHGAKPPDASDDPRRCIGIREGRGCFEWSQGGVYAGDFRDDAITGGGTLIWGDGRQYCGQWSGSEIHGQGRFEWPDGRAYEGHYAHGLMHGEGAFYWPDGCVFTGQWAAGQRHGSGIFHSPCGAEREGFWHEGVRVAWLDESPKMSKETQGCKQLGAVRLQPPQPQSPQEKRPDAHAADQSAGLASTSPESELPTKSVKLPSDLDVEDFRVGWVEDTLKSARISCTSPLTEQAAAQLDVATLRSAGRCLVPRFDETPQSVDFMCIWFALSHINASGAGCCPLHITLARLVETLALMRSEPCRPSFSPLDGWQCAQCRAVNSAKKEGGRAGCEICGHSSALPDREPELELEPQAASSEALPDSPPPPEPLVGPGPRVVHKFAETPRRVHAKSIFFALEHINCRGEGCCGFHIGLSRIQASAEELSRSRACLPNFAPHLGWQCSSCLGLNAGGPEVEALCEICGSVEQDMVLSPSDFDLESVFCDSLVVSANPSSPATPMLTPRA